MESPGYRIASYCSSLSWGGLEMNVLRFLRWMSQRGWDVILYADPAARLYREAGNLGIATRPVVARLPAGDLTGAWRLARLMRRDGVRRLIVHRSFDLFLGALARLLSFGHTRLLYHQHMHIGGQKKDPYHAWLYRRIDAFITPVEWLAERVLEKTSVPPNRLHIIPRGVEIERFTVRRPSRTDARERYGLPSEAVVIGLIGRLDPKKGQDIAIRALARLHQAGYRPHLLLVGDQSFDEGDAFASSIHQLVGELGLSDCVHFRPHQSDVEGAYAALDIFVLASKSECYGMVTVEALVSGLPVVGTNDGGTVSLIHHGQNGLLFQPGNVTALAEALASLLDDPERVRRMGAAAQREGMVKFSHVRQCESWEQVLAGLD